MEQKQKTSKKLQRYCVKYTFAQQRCKKYNSTVLCNLKRCGYRTSSERLITNI